MSTLKDTDIKEFERESDSKIFTNVPYVDDKLKNDSNILSLLINLGFTRIDDEGNSSLFNIF